MSTKFISSSLVLLSVIFSGCNKVPQVEVQKAPESKAIVIKTDTDLAKSVHIKIEGRKIKSYIQDLLVECSAKRDIDLKYTSILFSNQSLASGNIACGGNGKTVKGQLYVDLRKSIGERYTVISLNKNSPLLGYKLPGGKTALFLAEGFKAGKFPPIEKGKIGVNLIPTPQE